MTPFFWAIGLYILILLVIGFASYRKSKTSTDFVIGGRTLNFYVTALSAHASDMSSWLFMAYPALIYTQGGIQIWTAVGLLLGMFASWQFVAPRLRRETERFQSVTLAGYFHLRFEDRSGALKAIGALLSLLFFTVYVAAGLVGIGYLFETVMGLPAMLGMSIGILVVILYTSVGGFVSICWIDLFQGIFLLAVIIAVPLFAIQHIGGWGAFAKGMASSSLSWSLFPSVGSFGKALLISLGWGLGYFGQTHILTKFMGIQDVREIPKSKYLGMSWQALCFFGATLVGMVGLLYFPSGLANSELVFVLMVKGLFHPFMAGVILCAILAATISTMDSQIIVLTSVCSVDLYQHLFRPKASAREALWSSRISVIFIACVSYIIAVWSGKNVEDLVFYSWSGLGSTFGALLILALYSQVINRNGALFGMIYGGIVSAVWPAIGKFLPLEVPALIPGFLLNLPLIYFISKWTNPKKSSLQRSPSGREI